MGVEVVDEIICNCFNINVYIGGVLGGDGEALLEWTLSESHKEFDLPAKYNSFSMGDLLRILEVEKD